VVNSPAAGSATAAAYLAEKKGDAHALGFFNGVWMIHAATSAGGESESCAPDARRRLVLEPAVMRSRTDSNYKTLPMGFSFAAATKNQASSSSRADSITSRDNVVGSSTAESHRYSAGL